MCQMAFDALQLLAVNNGIGTDLRGQDATTAASHAFKDAASRASLLG